MRSRRRLPPLLPPSPSPFSPPLPLAQPFRHHRPLRLPQGPHVLVQELVPLLQRPPSRRRPLPGGHRHHHARLPDHLAAVQLGRGLRRRRVGLLQRRAGGALHSRRGVAGHAGTGDGLVCPPAHRIAAYGADFRRFKRLPWFFEFADDGGGYDRERSNPVRAGRRRRRRFEHGHPHRAGCWGVRGVIRRPR